MNWRERVPISAAILAALAVLAAPSVAQAVTVTDCTMAPVVAVGKKTVLDVRPDDLVLQCQLEPLPGTERILVRANNVTIDGPAGGIASPAKGVSIEVRADGELIIMNASLDAANSNARMRLIAVTGIKIDGSNINVGDGIKPGRDLRIQCTGADCPFTFCNSTFQSGHVNILIQGQITGDDSLIQTRSPRDRIRVRSFTSHVIFCRVDMRGGPEGRIEILAFGDVDLSQGEYATGRFIIVRAGLGGAGQAILRDATLRNDFGKFGHIIVEAAGGAGQVDIEGATLIDDDKPATVNDVSTINGREEVPHTGFNNTVGTPNLDT